MGKRVLYRNRQPLFFHARWAKPRLIGRFGEFFFVLSPFHEFFSSHSYVGFALLLNRKSSGAFRSCKAKLVLRSNQIW